MDGRLGGAEGLGHDFLEAGQLHPAVHLRDHLAQAVIGQAGLRGRLLGHLEHRLVHHAVLHAVLIKLRHTGIAAVAFLLGHFINAGGHFDVAGGVIRVGDPAPLLLRRTSAVYSAEYSCTSGPEPPGTGPCSGRRSP